MSLFQVMGEKWGGDLEPHKTTGEKRGPLLLVHTEELLLHLVHLEVGLPQRRELPVVFVVRCHPTEHFYFYGMFKRISLIFFTEKHV